jgi:hypothetical protein
MKPTHQLHDLGQTSGSTTSLVDTSEELILRADISDRPARERSEIPFIGFARTRRSRTDHGQDHFEST